MARCCCTFQYVVHQASDGACLPLCPLHQLSHCCQLCCLQLRQGHQAATVAARWRCLHLLVAGAQSAKLPTWHCISTLMSLFCTTEEAALPAHAWLHQGYIGTRAKQSRPYLSPSEHLLELNNSHATNTQQPDYKPPVCVGLRAASLCR